MAIIIGVFIFAFAVKFFWLYLLAIASLLLIAKVANDDKPPTNDDEVVFLSTLDRKEKICSSCGAKIDADSSFCSECGSAI